MTTTKAGTLRAYWELGKPRLSMMAVVGVRPDSDHLTRGEFGVQLSDSQRPSSSFTFMSISSVDSTPFSVKIVSSDLDQRS